MFGSGGDKDPGKRPLLGAAASALADKIVLTNDNPRGEAPEAIIEAIISGMDRPPDHVDLEREQAIAWAIEHAAPGDAILFAGFGADRNQTIGSIERPYFERDAIEAALRRRRGSKRAVD